MIERHIGFVDEDLDVALLQVFLSQQDQVLIHPLLLKNTGAVDPVETVHLCAEHETFEVNLREHIGPADVYICQEDLWLFLGHIGQSIFLLGFLLQTGQHTGGGVAIFSILVENHCLILFGFERIVDVVGPEQELLSNFVQVQ